MSCNSTNSYCSINWILDRSCILIGHGSLIHNTFMNDCVQNSICFIKWTNQFCCTNNRQWKCINDSCMMHDNWNSSISSKQSIIFRMYKANWPWIYLSHVCFWGFIYHLKPTKFINIYLVHTCLRYESSRLFLVTFGDEQWTVFWKFKKKIQFSNRSDKSQRCYYFNHLILDKKNVLPLPFADANNFHFESPETTATTIHHEF